MESQLWTLEFNLVIAGAVITLLLFILNLHISLKGEEFGSFPVNIAMHVVGLLTAIANAIRMQGDAVDSAMGINVIAIVCILISLLRTIRTMKLMQQLENKR